MATVGNLVANLTMNSTGFTRGASNARGALAGLSASVKTSVAGISAAIAPVAGLFASAFAVGASLGNARTQLQAEQRLAAVLAATGNAAELSAQQISDFAAQRQGITNFGDEVTIAGASVLATFKEIKGITFTDAIAAAQDMSVVMEQDLKSSMVQIGKALNDPIKGLTALSRVGVSFTQQQKDQIRVMQEAGDIAGAQSVILAELQSEFGGAAEALKDPWVQFKNAIGDLSENLGFLLLPSINAIANGLLGVAGSLSWTTQKSKELGTLGAFYISNIGEMAYQSFLRAQLAATTFIADMTHLFTVTLPESISGVGVSQQTVRALTDAERQMMANIEDIGSNLDRKRRAMLEGVMNPVIPGLGRAVVDGEPVDAPEATVSEPPGIAASRRDATNSAIALGSRDALSAIARVFNRQGVSPELKAAEKQVALLEKMPNEIADAVSAVDLKFGFAMVNI